MLKKKLRQIELLLGHGKKVALACREAGIVEQTFYRWRKEYGELQACRLVDQPRGTQRYQPLQREDEDQRANGEGAIWPATDAVWTHVRGVGDQDHRRRVAGGQGQSRAQSRDPSGSFGEEAAKGTLLLHVEGGHF